MPFRNPLSKETCRFCLDAGLWIVLSSLHGDQMLLFGAELQRTPVQGNIYWDRQGIFSPPNKLKHLIEWVKNPFPRLKILSFFCQKLRRTREFCFSEEKVMGIDFVLEASVRRVCMCLCLHVHPWVWKGKKNTDFMMPYIYLLVLDISTFSALLDHCGSAVLRGALTSGTRCALESPTPRI